MNSKLQNALLETVKLAGFASVITSIPFVPPAAGIIIGGIALIAKELLAVAPTPPQNPAASTVAAAVAAPNLAAADAVAQANLKTTA